MTDLVIYGIVTRSSAQMGQHISLPLDLENGSTVVSILDRQAIYELQRNFHQRLLIIELERGAVWPGDSLIFERAKKGRRKRTGSSR